MEKSAFINTVLCPVVFKVSIICCSIICIINIITMSLDYHA